MLHKIPKNADIIYAAAEIMKRSFVFILSVFILDYNELFSFFKK
jgi:hypothetical protein